MTTNLRSAVRWLDSYADEDMKHKHEKPKESLHPGIHFHTSRPNGLVTPHGYLKPQIELIKLFHQVDNKQALLMFMDQYGDEQKAKRRKVLELRAIVSLDPAILPDTFKLGMDIDDMLVKSLETTAENLSEHFYGGQQLGYFLGIHHDKEHIHGHMFLLPYTDADRRICMSNSSLVWKIDENKQERINLLDHWRLEYGRVVNRDIYNIIKKKAEIARTATREQKIAIAQATLTAYHVTIELDNGPDMEVKTRRKATVFNFVRYMRTMKPASLDRLYSSYKKQTINLKEDLDKRSKVIPEVSEFINMHKTDVLGVIEDRNREIEFEINRYRENKGPIATALEHNKPKFIPTDLSAPLDLSKELVAFFAHQKTRKKARRVGTLNEMFRACQLQFALRDSPVPTFELIEESIVNGELPCALPVAVTPTLPTVSPISIGKSNPIITPNMGTPTISGENPATTKPSIGLS